MENTSYMISLAIARTLVARGWSVVPTAGDGEKRPMGSFAAAIRADDSAHFAGQGGGVLVQRPLPRIRRSVQARPVAQVITRRSCMTHA